jgi:ElaB/YqjD/DUF883 family membrane-anchored ribosome-binding protein
VTLFENKGLRLGVLFLVLGAVVLIWLVATSEPYRLTILLEETGGLKEDDPVIWKTFNIGRVEKIKPLVDNRIGVVISIKEDYISSMTTGTEFILRQASFLGLVGKNAIEVMTPASPGAPLANGSRIPGKVPSADSALDAGKKWTFEYLDRVAAGIRKLNRDFQDSPYRDDLASALDTLKDLSDQGSRQAMDRLEQFRKDHQKEWDEAVRKLERMRDDLRKQGEERKARQVEEELNRMKLPAEAPLR